MRYFILNKTYTFTELEEIIEELKETDPNITMDEAGIFELGKSFIWIDMAHKTYSFVMTGFGKKGSVYTLIYET